MDKRRPIEPNAALARALSKLGFCSRHQAWDLIKGGRVRVNGVVLRDPETRIALDGDRIEVDGQRVRGAEKIYLMLNKPRGLITTVSDEQGRATVFECFSDGTKGRQVAEAESVQSGARSFPRVFPVGRLDKASEGLLLFTNDTAWANRISAPEGGIEKTYHVQVNCLADGGLARRIREGIMDGGDLLAAKRVHALRHGAKNSWLEVVLDEGKNRHIRRLLAALGVNVVRLVRVAVGPLQLGSLAKGQWRHLAQSEVSALAVVQTGESVG